MAQYRVRKVCDTEIGDGKGWHYFYADQDVLDPEITCPTHPAADTRDFTVIHQEETMEITLHQGKDLRLKWIGYVFEATPSGVTDYDFQMPMDAHIQEGFFDASESKTGDRISFITAYGTPYEYAYVDNVPVTRSEIFNPKEEFGMSALVPAGIPMRISYNNTHASETKTIVFKIALRLPD